MMTTAAPRAPADLILADAHVWCGDAARRWARAVAVRGDRIVAVGMDEKIRSFQGPHTEVVTLAGRTIVPGFVDAHIHPSMGGHNLLNVNLDDLGTLEDYLARIRAHAEANPEAEWITGGGWASPLFGEQGPRREDLDAVVPDRPVFLMNTDVHGAWVNSKALAMAGITAATPDPWDGYYARDASGEPTGALQEGAAYAFARDLVPMPLLAHRKACLRRAQQELLALGVTAWQDAWVEPELLRAYRELDDAGELVVRVVTALWWDRHRGPEQIDDLIEQRAWGSGGRVDAGTVKIMLDGCPENGTGAMLAPYEAPFGERHGTGIRFVDPDALTEALVRLDALGFQVHQHALGDGAVRMALDAVQAARRANGWNDHRHHVAHLQLPDPADIPRLRDLGVVANFQPYWSQPDPGIETVTMKRVGSRAEHLYPIGAVKASGAVMAFGSDWPVSTPDPLLEIEVAVNRQVPGRADSAVLHPEQRIDLHAALAAFTRGSAYVNHQDDAGVVAPGMRADLAVIDRDVFDRELGAIGDAEVEMTLVEGAVVYEAKAEAR
jgi:predicted amidohydrolase YtcJ